MKMAGHAYTPIPPLPPRWLGWNTSVNRSFLQNSSNEIQQVVQVERLLEILDCC